MAVSVLMRKGKRERKRKRREEGGKEGKEGRKEGRKVEREKKGKRKEKEKRRETHPLWCWRRTFSKSSPLLGLYPKDSVACIMFK